MSVGHLRCISEFLGLHLWTVANNDQALICLWCGAFLRFPKTVSKWKIRAQCDLRISWLITACGNCINVIFPLILLCPNKRFWMLMNQHQFASSLWGEVSYDCNFCIYNLTVNIAHHLVKRVWFWKQEEDSFFLNNFLNPALKAQIDSFYSPTRQTAFDDPFQLVKRSGISICLESGCVSCPA